MKQMSLLTAVLLMALSSLALGQETTATQPSASCPEDKKITITVNFGDFAGDQYSLGQRYHLRFPEKPFFDEYIYKNGGKALARYYPPTEDILTKGAYVWVHGVIVNKSVRQVSTGSLRGPTTVPERTYTLCQVPKGDEDAVDTAIQLKMPKDYAPVPTFFVK